MMGRHARQNELWSEPVNLARRIPPDHPLRKLRETVKLEFVREEVARSYGRKGNVSVDPVIVMKMMLLLFWDNVRSERELMRIIPLRIDYLWFLGYSLEDEIPNHSVLSKARRRWGAEVFARLFRQSVQQCLEAGLIEGSKLHTDSSLVRADASLNSVVAVTLAKLEESAEEEPTKRGGGGPVNQRHRVATDPDSALVRQTSGKSHPSYKAHRALDDQVGVITAVKTTNGIRDDGAELSNLLTQHRENTARKPRAVVADCKYGTTANFIALASQGIRSHMGDLRSRLSNHQQNDIYPAARFKYDEGRDTYRCPAGRLLYRHHFNRHRGYYDYRTRPGVCGRCRLAAYCTRSKAGRSLNRYPDHHLLERARHQSHGPAAQRDRKRRQWLQERNFAEATTQHGFKRARWRGLAKQTIQDQLIATLQNLKILLRRAGLGYLATLDFLQMCLTQLAAIRSGFPLFRQAHFT
ncbi:MAG: DDE transposase [Candidatus Zixiibacteriota bacterium]|nr:MAG: DDE transposase [candidate division Zixibacteria bacterium]